MSAPRRRLVIFDVDGTLVDSQDHIVAAMHAAFSAEGLTTPARQAVLAIVGLSLPEALAALAALRARVDDPSPLVREHVAWAIARLEARAAAGR